MKLKGSGLSNKEFLPEHNIRKYKKNYNCSPFINQWLSSFLFFLNFFPDACFGKLINNFCYLDELSQVSRHAVASEDILLGQGLTTFVSFEGVFVQQRKLCYVSDAIFTYLL